MKFMDFFFFGFVTRTTTIRSALDKLHSRAIIRKSRKKKKTRKSYKVCKSP